MRISDWSSDVCSSDLDLINAAFPDAASTRGYFGSSMRWSTASVIIAFPLFTLLARHLARDAHLVRHAGEDGRLDEKAGLEALQGRDAAAALQCRDRNSVV